MDSLTQLVLGGALAAAVAPPQHRRAALLAGMALGTLPDLDSLVLLPLGLDPVDNMTWHRGPSHSLFVLIPLAALIWAAFKRLGGRVAESPVRWFWAMQLVLVTHPLLDALTVYGTQLWWPLAARPTMWSTLFIIDLAYTLPLLVACVLAWRWRGAHGAQRALVAGLALSTLYIGWSFLAKAKVERAAGQAVAAMGLQDAPRFSVPMPFNTLLWQVVVMTPDGYLSGQYSVVADEGAVRLYPQASDVAAMAAVREFPAVARLRWFNHGFMSAREVDGSLVLSDLRMGLEPDFTFRFTVAERDGAGWKAVPPTQADWPTDAIRRLPEVWHRIWAPEPAP